MASQAAIGYLLESWSSCPGDFFLFLIKCVGNLWEVFVTDSGLLGWLQEGKTWSTDI
jgi:hypothetical protein